MTGLVVDSSAIVAVLQGEAAGPWLAEQLAEADTCVMAVPTALELGIVLESRHPGAIDMAERSIRDAHIDLVSFDEKLGRRALQAWRRFGKGRHPAALNLGDCFTYALAEDCGWPILCIGDDFRRTDLETRQPA